jgi:2',3'-cyclic-nucleotide 2'-phosphodiesterase (5'-nucleotidase family)
LSLILLSGSLACKPKDKIVQNNNDAPRNSAAAQANEAEGRQVTILNINNVQGEIDSCGCRNDQLGGLAKRATIIENIAQRSPHLLLLDAGDCFFGSLRLDANDIPTLRLRQHIIVDAYNAIGYTALNVGEKDLADGVENLLDLSDKAEFPFISANLYYKNRDKPIFSEYLIKEVNGINFGIFGLANASFDPGAINATNLIVKEPEEQARRLVELLAPQVNIIILLSDLGFLADKELAKRVPGIQLIISGHSSTYLTDLERVGDTYLAAASSRGKYLGQIDLNIKNSVYRLSNPDEKKNLSKEQGIVMNNIQTLEGRLNQIETDMKKLASTPKDATIKKRFIQTREFILQSLAVKQQQLAEIKQKLTKTADMPGGSPVTYTLHKVSDETDDHEKIVAIIAHYEKELKP